MFGAAAVDDSWTALAEQDGGLCFLHDWLVTKGPVFPSAAVPVVSIASAAMSVGHGKRDSTAGGALGAFDDDEEEDLEYAEYDEAEESSSSSSSSRKIPGQLRGRGARCCGFMPLPSTNSQRRVSFRRFHVISLRVIVVIVVALPAAAAHAGWGASGTDAIHSCLPLPHLRGTRATDASAEHRGCYAPNHRGACLRRHSLWRRWWPWEWQWEWQWKHARRVWLNGVATRLPPPPPPRRQNVSAIVTTLRNDVS